MFAGHWVHVLIGPAVLGLMLASTLPLEVAFAYDRYARLVWIASPVIFVAATAATILGLAVDTKLTRQRKSYGLLASLITLVLSAVVNFAAMRQNLPAYPLTLATFQTWTAQAAYLKGLVYCTAFASLFVLLSFHFVVTMQRELLEGRHETGFCFADQRLARRGATRRAVHAVLGIRCSITCWRNLQHHKHCSFVRGAEGHPAHKSLHPTD